MESPCFPFGICASAAATRRTGSFVPATRSPFQHHGAGHQQQGPPRFRQAPVPGTGSPGDVGQRRTLPTLPVDQFAATLAPWMGVSPTNLSAVMPGLGDDGARDLGLFAQLRSRKPGRDRWSGRATPADQRARILEASGLAT
jgi:hypothetical protein